MTFFLGGALILQDEPVILQDEPVILLRAFSGETSSQMLFDDLFLWGGLILQDEPVILLYALVFLSIVVLYKEAYKKRQKKLRSAQPRQN